MWLMRLLAALSLIAIAVGLAGFALTKDRRYLDFSARFFRYVLALVLLFFAFMIFERLALMA
ncbi:MAG: hypothetical protein V4623_01335 [Pseudomonadota bacterium]